MPSELKRVCITCHWWLLDPDTKLGSCHAKAPTRDLTCKNCCFPPTPPLEFCGDWKEEPRAGIEARKVILQVVVVPVEPVITHTSAEKGALLNWG